MIDRYQSNVSLLKIEESASYSSLSSYDSEELISDIEDMLETDGESEIHHNDVEIMETLK